MGVPKNFLRPCPLERQKMPFLENTDFYKQSGSEKISITLKMDKVSWRVIKHQAKQVRTYIISLNKIKHLENEQNGFQSRRTVTTKELTIHSCVRVMLPKNFLAYFCKNVGGGALAPASPMAARCLVKVAQLVPST